MRKMFFLFVCLVSSLLLAENLVQNSDFSIAAGKDMMLWSSPNRAKNGIQFIRADGKTCVQFSSQTPVTPYVRQYGLYLVPGEKYRISFDISSEGLSYKKMWCVVANLGWKKDAGFKRENGELKTDGIQRFEKEFVAPDSPDNSFSIAFYLQNAIGSCRLYRVSLEPLTEKARLESRGNSLVFHPYMGILALDRMSIPQEQNQLAIALSWVEGAPVALQAEVDGKPLPEQLFKDGRAFLDVSLYKAGTHHLHLKAVQNGKVLVERDEDFAFAKPLPEFHHTRKGFTEELLNVKTDGQSRFEFIVPTDGWCFIGVQSEPEGIVPAMLDDSIELYPKGSYRNESMRNLSRGVHHVTFKEPVKGTLQVRSIPLVLKYAGVSRVVSFPSMPPYDWEWHKKHVVGRSANYGPDGVKKDFLEESKLFGVTYGRRYHVNRTQAYTPEQAEKTLAEFNSCPAMLDKDAYYVGMDEYEWSDLGALLNFADISNRVSNPYNKYIMHWIASRNGPNIDGLYHYVLEQFLNMGGGKGLLAFELYFGTQKTEEEARSMITDAFTSIVDETELFFPGIASRTLLCFSNMNHPTYITSALHTNVNFKYFMDLEMNLLANSPAGSRIGGIGYWGCHYADEDVNLWTQELYKHYCCDGRTDMLSDQYGYTYIMPYLKNSDFSEGLDGYTVKGEATVETIFGFSRNSLRHWASVGSADRVAVLSPGTTIETTAVQLDPTATYKLEYVAADYEDVKNNIVNPKRIPVSVELSNAEVLAKFDKVDDATRKSRNNVPRIHYYVTHFRPKSATMPMVFTYCGEDGRKCTLNFIKIEPLFVKKQ